MTHITTRFLILFFLSSTLVLSTRGVRAAVSDAHNFAKTPVAAADADDASVAKLDDKAKPAPTPKPKPKPGPRDDGDGD